MLEETQKHLIINEAHQYWQKEYPSPLRAGMLIFERITLEDRPRWAASILEYVYRHVQPILEIDAILDFAQTPEKWPQSRYSEAHKLFDAARHLRLKLPAKDRIKDRVLALAEHVAGVTYTSRQYPAPFDHNRGWKIAVEYKDIVELLHMDEAAAWQVFSNEAYLQLDAPVSCHSQCPYCHPPRWDYLTSQQSE